MTDGDGDALRPRILFQPGQLSGNGVRILHIVQEHVPRRAQHAEGARHWYDLR